MNRTLFGLVVAAVAFAANAGDASMKTGFKDLDANGDGKLSSAEVSSQSTLSKDFKTLDSNGDGALSESEYAGWSGKSPAPADTTEPKPTTNP
ncbi:MAG TPA: EF-hand domain-containing protein, partial [Steroidobacteraceae bacterium]|nr:EF-hand domain-containing protein [Steroidobacteraceae bacterium]